MRTFGACGEVRTHPVHLPWLRACHFHTVWTGLGLVCKGSCHGGHHTKQLYYTSVTYQRVSASSAIENCSSSQSSIWENCTYKKKDCQTTGDRKQEFSIAPYDIWYTTEMDSAIVVGIFIFAFKSCCVLFRDLVFLVISVAFYWPELQI